MLTLAASTASTASSSEAAYVMSAAFAALLVGVVGFFGSQKPKPVGLGFGFYPALFLGAGGASVTFFGAIEVFSALHVI
ncbi:hypothetical protein [Streptomyces sp. NPDC049040]|uniref:hypothetical protein n=1 Tax=Streptomyces sp. NPDC049040 TaxID=3365593 RepID=UPI003721B434